MRPTAGVRRHAGPAGACAKRKEPGPQRDPSSPARHISDTRWRQSRPAAGWARRSERQQLVGPGAELGRVGWGHPASVDLREVLVGRPTGDGASLSDVDRDGVIPQLRDQLAHGRHTDALHLLEVVAEQHLGRVAGEEHSGVVADFDRTVRRELSLRGWIVDIGSRSARGLTCTRSTKRRSLVRSAGQDPVGKGLHVRLRLPRTPSRRCQLVGGAHRLPTLRAMDVHGATAQPRRRSGHLIRPPTTSRWQRCGRGDCSGRPSSRPTTTLGLMERSTAQAASQMPDWGHPRRA
jgi:hypothetical protein